MVETALKGIIKIIKSSFFRTWFVITGYVLLYYIYSDKGNEAFLARSVETTIHLNQSFWVICQMILTLTWHSEAQTKAHKALFLSFAMVSLIRLLYRIYAIAFNDYIITSTPMYFMIIICATPLILIDLKYGNN